ncbi:50S ribosomal protein L17 [Candidatus Woesebacteria bacterium]|nr:50S ribosomal protein L17 [Candidatus Woesebacteria bacterium]
MRKQVFGRHLSREHSTRIALFRSLIRAIVVSGQIVTTKAKAKAVLPTLEKVINLSKNDSSILRRKVLRELGNDKETMEKLFKSVGPLFKSRNGGYSRIVLLTKRVGDKADMVRLELTEKLVVAPKKEEKKSTKKVAPKKAKVEIVKAEKTKETK